MLIVTTRYTTAEHIPIEIITDSEEVWTIPTYPSNTNFDIAVQEFLDNGGVIEPYDQYYGFSDDDLREGNYVLNAALADGQIQLAEETPVAGPTLTTRQTEKENLRRNNRGKRNNKMTDADDVMADHVDSIMDVLDQADDEVENLSRPELEAWDGSTIIWPVWVSPPG